MLALVLGVLGTADAAPDLITSKDIKDRSIRSVDVGSRQLRPRHFVRPRPSNVAIREKAKDVLAAFKANGSDALTMDLGSANYLLVARADVRHPTGDPDKWAQVHHCHLELVGALGSVTARSSDYSPVIAGDKTSRSTVDFTSHQMHLFVAPPSGDYRARLRCFSGVPAVVDRPTITALRVRRCCKP